jgi:hypothetical protein
LLVGVETKGAFMAKRPDDMDMPQRSERDREDDVRGTGTDDVRGIARDEGDDLEDDEFDEPEEDESEDL